MKKIDESEVLQFVLSREEGRSLEFKPGFDWTDGSSTKLKEEVIKAIMAMSNTPQGGDIVLGKVWDGTTGKHLPNGVSPSQKNYFLKNYEQIEQEVHKYCSQTPLFEIQWGEAPIETVQVPFIFIRVSSFTEYPVLTVENGTSREDSGSRDFVIKEDTLYVRSMRARWSSRKATWREFEEVIRLAAGRYKTSFDKTFGTNTDMLETTLKNERSEYDK